MQDFAGLLGAALFELDQPFGHHDEHLDVFAEGVLPGPIEQFAGTAGVAAEPDFRVRDVDECGRVVGFEFEGTLHGRLGFIPVLPGRIQARHARPVTSGLVASRRPRTA